MKKPALIRSEKPHAVQVTEGSGVAQRKSTAKKTASPASPEPLKNIQVAPPDKVVKPRRVTAPKAPTIAEKAPPPEVAPTPAPKARSKAKQQATSVSKPAPKPVALKKRKASPRTSSKKMAPAVTAPGVAAALPNAPEAAVTPSASTTSAEPALPVWEKDNAVKTRIEELQALNAQLTEQLQRLPTNRSLRGAKP